MKQAAQTGKCVTADTAFIQRIPTENTEPPDRDGVVLLYHTLTQPKILGIRLIRAVSHCLMTAPLSPSVTRPP